MKGNCEVCNKYGDIIPTLSATQPRKLRCSECLNFDERQKQKEVKTE
jgi:hypothetical protein